MTSELLVVVLLSVVPGAGVGAGEDVVGAGVSTTVGVEGVCWHPAVTRPNATKTEAEMHFWIWFTE